MATNSAITDDGFLELYRGDPVRISSESMVDEGDVGKLALCLVVTQYKTAVGDQRESQKILCFPNKVGQVGKEVFLIWPE